MTRPIRILTVTLGLVATGALLGALAGVVAFGIAELLTDGPASVIRDPAGIILIGASFGAPLGGLLGPAVAWVALRNVPFGRMFVWSVAGTVIGGVVGWIVGPGYAPMDTALLGACGGLCVAAFLLWRTTHRRGLPAG